VGFLHPIECVVLPVLHLDPVRRPASLIGSVAVFRDKALQPKLASLAEQVRPDLSLQKGAEENSFRPAGQEPLRTRATA